MRKHLLFVGILSLLFSCTKTESLVHYVDPMIGTDLHGHTFPGATTPYGMVQLSPSNDFKNWDWCSGYHYTDSIIKGFAHNHISGAGLSGLGDILIMPTMGIKSTYAGTDQEVDSSYRSRFTHDDEQAYAGYYEVYLKDYQINAALTATTRSGFHKYTFEQEGEGVIVIDPTHSLLEKAVETSVEKVSDSEIRGFKKVNMGEDRYRHMYFSAKFSIPFKEITLTDNDKPLEVKSNASVRTKALISFDVKKGDEIELVVTLSPVSYQGVEKNYEADKGKTFNDALKQAKESWNNILNKIVLSDNTPEANKRTFYTAMYHSSISPNVISDVDGNYVLEGKKLHSQYEQYSNYSTWDTYRALHPLMTIINQKKTAKIVNSLITRDTEANTGQPVWELSGFDNYCMIGYSTAPVIAEAVLKDIEGIDPETAYASIRNAAFDLTKHSAVYDVSGLEDYINYGYVTGETGSSVSKTTEYNYHDYAIGKVAEKLGKEEDAELFIRRSKGYRSLFDIETGFLLPKFSNGESNKIDMTIWDGLITNYVSGNIWAYSAYTPHDMRGIIGLHGGKKNYAAWLDEIFSDTTHIGGAQHVDISGFIGKYGHGDEPGHQMAYLYNFVDQSWKTQKYVNKVIRTMYSDQPDGLVNNEDLGQMSAWYIFSTLGFYPVAPASLTYQLGAPFHKEASISLENGKVFKVRAHNLSKENIYVQSVKLNQIDYKNSFITHADIMQGGLLEFTMGAEPNTTWYSPAESMGLEAPEIMVLATPAPYDANGSSFFAREHLITLGNIDEKAKIYYTIDGSSPTEKSKPYSTPVSVDENATLKAVAVSAGLNPSKVYIKPLFKSVFPLLDKGYPKYELLDKETPYGKGDGSMLFDEITGSQSYGDGKWTGTKSKIEVNMDLGKPLRLTGSSVGILTDPTSWILPAKRIEIYAGNSKENLTLVAEKEFQIEQSYTKEVNRHSLKFDGKYRYLKFKIEPFGEAPEWHEAAGKKAWLFVDEIIIY